MTVPLDATPALELDRRTPVATTVVAAAVVAAGLARNDLVELEVFGDVRGICRATSVAALTATGSRAAGCSDLGIFRLVVGLAAIGAVPALASVASVATLSDGSDVGAHIRRLPRIRACTGGSAAAGHRHELAWPLGVTADGYCRTGAATVAPTFRPLLS